MVCCIAVKKGEIIEINSRTYEIETDINVGHKVALSLLNPGDKIIKYGMPIGSVTKKIRVGEHVHTHNMKSDYIPSHTRNKQQELL